MRQFLPRTIIDNALELAVVPSFSKVGPVVRRRLFEWKPLRQVPDRRVVITGANSGIGFAGARLLAAQGAHVTVVARNDQRGSAAVESIRSDTGNTNVGLEIADLSDLASVRALAERLLEAGTPIDVLVHNAGALHGERLESANGIELTLATHVVGPFLLTTLVRPLLAAGDDARIVTMASGGLYSQGISLSDLQTRRDYTGTKAYARAKRSQLLLNARWETELADDRISVYTMHPGWANTPGVADALPGFDTIMRPLLRSPEEGADTLAWLSTEPSCDLGNGGFWLDRARRPEHRLPKTKSADHKVDALWGEIAALAART